MFDDAARTLEEIEPEHKTRKEVLGARVDLYMAAKKWDMAAAVANHLIKVEPENASWWITLAMRRAGLKASRKRRQSSSGRVSFIAIMR